MTNDDTAATATAEDAAQSQTKTSSDEEDVPFLKPSITEFEWRQASAVAAGTLVVEYALVALAFVLGPSSVNITSSRETLIQFAYILYNAHHVPIATTVSGEAIRAGARLQNALYGQPEASIPPIVFFLLPVVALLAAGFVFEHLRDAPEHVGKLEESAMVGTGIAIGYVAMGVIGSFVLVRRITFDGGSSTAAPALLWILVAMFLFPMVFATVGAAIGYEYDAGEIDIR